MHSSEPMVFDEGFSLICGIDEVGRGCLAGPVVAAAVVLPKEPRVEGVRDSKKLSPKKREEINRVIREQALAIGLGTVQPEIIDQINIKQATRLAMKLALEDLKDNGGSPILPDIVLVDAEEIETKLPQRCILHGDDLIYQIAAASIVAKVYRDQMFESYEEQYPGYGLASNKGYGTKAHFEGIEAKGITPIHRRSFLKKFHASNPPSHLVSGTKGEEMVHRLLLKRGYRILERNYRSKLGEIDIIAMDKEVLVFVEVKSRSNNLYGEPGDFVDKRKQQRIMMTAELFMKQHNLTDLQPRFDVAEVYWERGGIRYIQNGFPGF